MTPEQRNQRQNLVLISLCFALAPEALGTSSHKEINEDAVAAIVYIFLSMVFDKALGDDKLKYFLRIRALVPLIKLVAAAFTCVTDPTLISCPQPSKT